MSHCLDYYNFVVSFKITTFEPSNFVIFKKLFWLFYIPVEFRISLSIFAEKKAEVLMRLMHEFVDQFVEYCHLNHIKFSDPKKSIFKIYLSFLNGPISRKRKISSDILHFTVFGRALFNIRKHFFFDFLDDTRLEWTTFVELILDQFDELKSMTRNSSVLEVNNYI